MEGALQLMRHMQATRQVELKRHRRARVTGEQSARDETKVNAVFYHFLSVEFYQRVLGTFKHYLRVKAPKGCGSSTWRQYTFLRAQPLRLHARDMMCGCSGCTRVPISPCLGTHLAGPVHSLKLDRAKTKAQADSSPAAEDEQGGPSLVDDE